jgi:hypothetical protein
MGFVLVGLLLILGLFGLFMIGRILTTAVA